jgi:hypothetical protein
MEYKNVNSIQNYMTKYFAIKSKYFSLYKAFREEAEKAGWQYNDKFNAFEEDKAESCSCLFFHLDWNREGRNPMFSFSNHSEIVFELETQWDIAIVHMTQVFESGLPKQKLSISLKNLAEHHGVSVEDIIITS